MEKHTNLKVYLYNATGSDEEINFEQIDVNGLDDTQLLWIEVSGRDENLVAQIVDRLEIKEVRGAFLRKIIETSERPKLDKFKDFYRFFIVSAELGKSERLEKRPIDFLVGKNFVVTISDKAVDYFEEFREREKGETRIGELDAESFVASLLDWHIVSYFRVLEKIEQEVDELDDEILGGEIDYDKFLTRMVKLRGDVSKLRRWFLPHRDIFYALSRPDFFPVADADDSEHFKILSDHFESAVDIIESSRDTVVSLFDLYSTKTGERTNRIMQRLTFITLLIGSLGVAAGILGMNFKLDFFESENGFWIILAAMGIFSVITSAIGYWRKWF